MKMDFASKTGLEQLILEKNGAILAFLTPHWISRHPKDIPQTSTMNLEYLSQNGLKHNSETSCSSLHASQTFMGGC